MTDKTPEPTPPGVLAILTAPDGHVISSVSDFDRSGYGGFMLKEAQTLRVKRALAFAVMRAYCSDVILKAIDAYRCEEIVGALIRDHGHKRTIVAVGHADD